MIIVIFLYVTLLQYIILHYYNWVSTPERQFQSMWWMRQNILKPDWICKNDKWVVYGFVCENDFDKSSCEKWPGAVCLSVFELLRHRWSHLHHTWWMCYTNTRDGSYLFFKGHAPTWGTPPPMSKAKMVNF